MNKQNERRKRKDELKRNLELIDAKRAPLKGSGGMYEHIATLRYKKGIIEEMYVCFAESGQVKDALLSTKHMTNTADIKMKEYLIKTEKLKPSLYIEKVLMRPSEGQEFHTWLAKIEDNDLWTALVEVIVEHSQPLEMSRYQINSKD